MSSQDHESERTLSRRQLLKAIIAAGGAVTASTLLPSEWSKPVVEVGMLPAHAQEVSPPPPEEPEPVEYGIYCDSDPAGGGDILLDEGGNGTVGSITATIKVLVGTGPVAGIEVTMTAIVADSYPFPDSFSPALPRTATTNASGVASFGNQGVNGEDGDAFNLQFDYVDPVNGTPDNCVCGRYDLREVEE
jgi:hypothetical protein